MGTFFFLKRIYLFVAVVLLNQLLFTRLAVTKPVPTNFFMTMFQIIDNYYVFSNNRDIFSQISTSMRSYKDGASNTGMYPYPMKWSQRKVQFYEQHINAEASSCGFIIKSVATVNLKRLPGFCTWLRYNCALYWLHCHSSSMFSHL